MQESLSNRSDTHKIKKQMMRHTELETVASFQFLNFLFESDCSSSGKHVFKTEPQPTTFRISLLLPK